jgi:hypothetical protein
VTAVVTETRADEAVSVRVNRMAEALQAGLSVEQAEAFAESAVDVGELRRLVRDGCPPELIARILL